MNNRIRAREVRVMDADNNQLGVMSTADALLKAKQLGVDLVEVASNAEPPVCRLIDFGKYRYEQSKKEKENKKSQSTNKVKEIQLRPAIDPHDMKMKHDHAVDFLCHNMKVKVVLRFRGRENAHKDIGRGVMQNFIDDLEQWGHPDAPIRSAGRSINVMISPLPAQKRAANPRGDRHVEEIEKEAAKLEKKEKEEGKIPTDGSNASGFSNSPFDQLDSGDKES